MLHHFLRILPVDRPTSSDIEGKGFSLNGLSRILATAGPGRLEDMAQGRGLVANRAQRRPSKVQLSRETVPYMKTYIKTY